VLPWVDVLSIEALDGTRIAVLFTHAAHPVIVHAASTLISADYPGFAVETLRRVQGPDGVLLFAQGPAGNINAFPLQGGIGAAAAAGRDLGQAVSRALGRPGEFLPDGALRTASLELTLPLQAPASAATLKEKVAREKSAERKARLEELLAIAGSGEPRTMRYPVRALALGDRLCVVGLSHEPFAEYGRYVHEVSPFEHNLVLAYTNGLECYVATERDYRLGERGGYEASPWGAAFMFESRLPLAPEAEGQIRAGVVRLLRELKAG
jgi:hypothetical protein